MGNKTAVGTIIEKLQERINSQKKYIDNYNIPDCRLYLYKILDECIQALELEKQQIIDAYCADRYPKETHESAEKYYSETFKK